MPDPARPPPLRGERTKATADPLLYNGGREGKGRGGKTPPVGGVTDTFCEFLRRVCDRVSNIHLRVCSRCIPGDSRGTHPPPFSPPPANFGRLTTGGDLAPGRNFSPSGLNAQKTSNTRLSAPTGAFARCARASRIIKH